MVSKLARLSGLAVCWQVSCRPCKVHQTIISSTAKEALSKNTAIASNHLCRAAAANTQASLQQCDCITIHNRFALAFGSNLMALQKQTSSSSRPLWTICNHCNQGIGDIVKLQLPGSISILWLLQPWTEALPVPCFRHDFAQVGSAVDVVPVQGLDFFQAVRPRCLLRVEHHPTVR